MNHDLYKIVLPLLSWYDQNARILPWREDVTPYRVWISEIMLQQTRVEAGIPYFKRFVRALPNVEALAHVPEEKLLKLWEGLGYYNRAKNLQKAAKLIVSDHHGIIPANYKDLLSLPGIGEYTAGAIGSIAFGLPVPCVDGNVLRVITRITTNSGNIMDKKIRSAITAEIKSILPPNRVGDFNQSLMELGATICLPNGLPKCQICPIDCFCKSFAQNSMLDFPVKPMKKARKVEKRTVFILLHENKVALKKRSSSGLLASLWEFPNVEGSLSLAEAKAVLLEWGYSPQITIKKVKNAKHIFTHIEWQMCGYLVDCDSKVKNNGFKWKTKEQLEQKVAIPSAFNAFYLETINHLSLLD